MKVPVSISAFITKKMVENILDQISVVQYEMILLPGFIQWDTSELENKYGIPIRKGTEFASDLPLILENLEEIELSNKLAANKLLEMKGETQYYDLVQKNFTFAKDSLGQATFFINKHRSDKMIGDNLPPPIIAEIVNCTEKSDKSILRKVQHYLDSGADIIDIGCISNKPNPQRVSEILSLIRENHNCLISIDSMDTEEILTAVDEKIDLILSLDIGNYKEFKSIRKNIPIVILPTNIRKGYFPKDPHKRVENLLNLTKILLDLGFKKLIADPLLETPISPGIINSLQGYYLYRQECSKEENQNLRLPLFFGISNVVELMDVDSVGINGLLASIAIELDMGILFTVEHSTKMFGGVEELKRAMMLNYLSKYKNSPPINMGIQVFKAKGKTSQEIPDLSSEDILDITWSNTHYAADKAGYFKIYVDHYEKRIFVLFYSNEDKLLKVFSGNDAEGLSKEIIEMRLTNDLSHINYLGRELKKAEIYLNFGKPYIQDE